jgi:N-acetylglucosamine-6-phosphate deacetylase
MKPILNCNIVSLFAFISLTIAYSVVEAKPDNKVEGIFYLDGTPVEIDIKDGIIQKITRMASVNDKRNAHVFVAPGFIDHQLNGCFNIKFSSDDLTVKKVRQATKEIWKAGVTTYFPTLTTNSSEVLKHGFSVLAKAREDAELAASIPGYHLEGPYISPVEGFRGSHNKQWIRPPDWDEFIEWVEAAEGKIIQVTVAPELEGAIDFIGKCRRQGIQVALGHHNATADIVRAAVDAGASLCTHLGNGCANMIHRHDNPLWPQLAEDRLKIGIICDGFHLCEEEVRTFLKVKGVEKTIITSDASSLAGMPPGEYDKNGKKLVVTPDGMIKYPAQNVLAGSASLMDKGVGNIIKFTQCTLADAVHMASRNVAEHYNLDDRGVIEPGKRADLVLFTLENFKVNVKETYVAGKLVFKDE